MALAHAILAALNDRPCSGYDLAKQFDGSVGFFWNASHQQIYRELAKLEDKGYLSSKLIQQAGRPDKKQYQVTPAGTAFLTDWMTQPCEVTPIKDDLLVKLFAGYLVPRAAIVAELEQHHHQHSETLATYRQIEAEFFSQPQTLSGESHFRYLTLRNGICYETAWLAWCEAAIAALNSTDAANSPND